MSVRVGILATMAVFGLALLGVWLFAPAALIEMQRLLDRDTIKAAGANGLALGGRS
jgi:hypothetical protein